ncbi:Potassium channel subfamily K member 5 [Holothuria leucospilota]|uniref:Potassium channel subfamily K member 5 n=1 Tax=Holothuria leucospilota TaxID=206669 RepID=A0A9Q1CIJ5_HOLLE|nr:Potassium channel subfamily K member 5 [Holothuria leucospilota]
MLEGVWKTLAHRLYDAMDCIRLPTHRKICCLLLMSVFTYVAVIVLPSLAFKFTEHWGWFEAHYYTFSSLSTIGFGDYVAGYQPHEDNLYLTVYKVCVIVYIVLGLSVLAILFRVVQEYQEKQVGKVKNLTRSVTSKVIRNQRHSDFKSSMDKVGKNQDEETNGICLTKATFVTTGISGEIYHTDESGVSLSADRGTQTDAETIGILQEYSTLLRYGNLSSHWGENAQRYHVAVIENGHCEDVPQ